MSSNLQVQFAWKNFYGSKVFMQILMHSDNLENIILTIIISSHWRHFCGIWFLKEKWVYIHSHVIEVILETLFPKTLIVTVVTIIIIVTLTCSKNKDTSRNPPLWKKKLPKQKKDVQMACYCFFSLFPSMCMCVNRISWITVFFSTRDDN